MWVLETIYVVAQPLQGLKAWLELSSSFWADFIKTFETVCLKRYWIEQLIVKFQDVVIVSFPVVFHVCKGITRRWVQAWWKSSDTADREMARPGRKWQMNKKTSQRLKRKPQRTIENTQISVFKSPKQEQINPADLQKFGTMSVISVLLII